MFNKTRDQMNNWRWDNPRAFEDQVDRSNPQTTSSEKVKCTGEYFSWYGSDDLRAMIVPPSRRQYKPGDFLAIRPLNWNELINEDDDDENWADPGALSGGRRRPGAVNDNDNGEGEEDMHGGEKGTGERKGTKDGKWKGKGKGKRNGKGKGIVKQTPGGDDISHVVALQFQKEMYEADSDTEGWMERVYLEPEASLSVSISSDDDTHSTTKSDSKYDSEHDSGGDMRMEDDMDAPEGVDLDGDLDMEMDGDDDEEEDEEEEDDEKEDEEEVEEEDEDEEEDKDEDDGKEPWTIGQGEMVNTSADNADTMVDDEPTVLHEQGQKKCEHTPRPQPPAPAPWPQTTEPPPWRWTPETHTVSGLEFLWFLSPQKPRPVVPTLREADSAGNTSDVDVEHQLPGELAGGDSLPNIPLPDVPLPDVPLPDVPLPDIPLPDGPLPDVHLPYVSLPEARPDGSVGEKWTSLRVAVEACIWVRVGFLSCEFPLL